MSELIQVVREITNLLKEQELDRAIKLVEAAEKIQRQVQFEGKLRAVHELSSQIFQAQMEKRKLLQVVQTLPREEKFDAEHRLQPVIERYFDSEISTLRTEKRLASQRRS